MSGLVQYLEEAIFTFVKERIAIHEWKHIHSRYAIEERMEDDDVNELKDYVFDELMSEVDWNVILHQVQQLARNQLDSESESEETESESEESGDDDSDG